MGINLYAPVITRKEIMINAPISKIWDVRTDINSWTDWQPEVDSAHAEGPIVVGSSFHWKTKGLDITSIVVALEPEKYIEWGGPANGITAVHVWHFEQKTDGVHIKTEESWEGKPIKAAVDDMQRALDASLTEWLERLRIRSESRDS